MIALFLATALAAITVDPPARLGDETVVTVTDAHGRPLVGETVRVIHRPGLRGERQISAGLTDSLGRVRFDPELGGDALVRAGDQSLPFHVRWPSPPVGPVLNLGVALAFALGFVLYGVRRPLSSGPGPVPPPRRAK